MASAREIGRAGEDAYNRAVEVLVRPPLEPSDWKFVSEDLGRAVFGGNHHSKVGGQTGVYCSERLRLGDISQVVEIRVFDSRTENGVDLTASMAVDALHTYVTALAEGDIAKLQEFLPQQ